MKRFRFTQEQADFICNNYKKMELNDLIKAFNENFNLDVVTYQIKNKIRQLNITKRNIKENYGKYTDEMISWLVKNFETVKLDTLVENFNKRFKTDFTRSAIWHKIDRIMSTKYDRTRNYVPRLTWTKDLENFVKENYDNYAYKDLSELMNKKFNIKTTPSSIEHKVYRLGLKKTKQGIKKSYNHKAFSKFQYQKGHIPYSKKPIGYERVTPDGYIWIKVANPDIFKAKHRDIWEKANGKIPESHCLIFLDGNKQNCRLENLHLVSRGELGVLNKMGLQRNDAEITKTSLNLARLIIKISGRERRTNNAEKQIN